MIINKETVEITKNRNDTAEKESQYPNGVIYVKSRMIWDPESPDCANRIGIFHLPLSLFPASSFHKKTVSFMQMRTGMFCRYGQTIQMIWDNEPYGIADGLKDHRR